MDHIVSTTVFLKDISEFGKMKATLPTSRRRRRHERQSLAIQSSTKRAKASIAATDIP
jgi:hypothetical protein